MIFVREHWEACRLEYDCREQDSYRLSDVQTVLGSEDQKLPVSGEQAEEARQYAACDLSSPPPQPTLLTAQGPRLLSPVQTTSRMSSNRHGQQAIWIVQAVPS